MLCVMEMWIWVMSYLNEVFCVRCKHRAEEEMVEVSLLMWAVLVVEHKILNVVVRAKVSDCILLTQHHHPNNLIKQLCHKHIHVSCTLGNGDREEQ